MALLLLVAAAALYREAGHSVSCDVKGQPEVEACRLLRVTVVEGGERLMCCDVTCKLQPGELPSSRLGSPGRRDLER